MGLLRVPNRAPRSQRPFHRPICLRGDARRQVGKDFNHIHNQNKELNVNRNSASTFDGFIRSQGAARLGN